MGLAAGGEDRAEWVVYDVLPSFDLGVKIRYIFSAAAQIPAGLVQYICPEPYYIIDVLREREDRQGLASTAEESILSALEHGGNLKAMAIYTASQGRDHQEIEAKYPEVRIVSKVNPSDLNNIIGDFLIGKLEK